MLTAMTAVDNIIAGITDKQSLWAINTEMDYHEEKPDPAAEADKSGVSAVSPSASRT
jgi:hypothetical protein